MEGGRGGGRGKGKKSKLSKKKGLNGAKSVAQTLSVSASAQDSATATHEPMMFKSKRNRMKKAAAAEVLPFTATPSTVKSTVATAVPLKTKIAIATPASAAKPHVIPLTGYKKKKRKLSALKESGGALDASAGPKASFKRRGMKGAKGLAMAKTKKRVAVLGHGIVSSISETRDEAALASVSLKQAGQNAYKKESIQSQHARKKEIGATDAASVTNYKAVKQVTTTASLSSIVKLKDRKGGEVGVTKHQVQPGIDISASKSTIAKPKAVTHSRNISQTDDLVSIPTYRQSQVDQAQQNELKTVLSTNHEVGYTAETMTKVTSDAPLIASPESFETMLSLELHGTGIATVLPKRVVDTIPVARATTSDASFVSSSGFKRQRSVDEAFKYTETLQSAAKRTTVASSDGGVQSTTGQHATMPVKTFARREKTYALQQTEVNVEDLTMTTPSQTSRQTGTVKDDANKFLLATQEVDNETRTPALEGAVNAEIMPVAASSASNAALLSGEQPDSTTNVTLSMSALKGTDFKVTLETNFEKAAKAEKMDLVMDSHTYVEKVMRTEGEVRALLPVRNHDACSAQPIVALPPRPPNAWGASFGLVPPTSLAPRKLSTTPLSCWFLSKGSANFVKHVHFSDDGSSDDDDESLTRQLALRRGANKSSPKKKASLTKKNAFLESLKHQSSWRTWYGNVDVTNLLDPPLARVPENMRLYEAMLPFLPEPIANTQMTVSSRTSTLEMLEADIRQEKLRGSAFSLQLLMMLQGKTASGMVLEEEYNLLSQR